MNSFEAKLIENIFYYTHHLNQNYLQRNKIKFNQTMTESSNDFIKFNQLGDYHFWHWNVTKKNDNNNNNHTSEKQIMVKRDQQQKTF